MRRFSTLFFCVALLSQAIASGVAAQETAPRLSLELNRVDPLDGACRLTFLVQNGFADPLSQLALETVLIDAEGRVDRLTLFDFGELPAGTPRVRQFDLGGLSCEALGSVLINGVAECGGAVDCAGALELSTRTDVEVLG